MSNFKLSDPVQPDLILSRRVQVEKEFKKTLKFKKAIHSQKEVDNIRASGFFPVVSSFIDAIGQQDNNLFLRYSDGNIWMYKNQGKHFQAMITSVSKGSFAWNTMFRKNIFGVKVGAIKFVEAPKFVKIEEDVEEFQRLTNLEFKKARQLTLNKGLPPIKEEPPKIMKSKKIKVLKPIIKREVTEIKPIIDVFSIFEVLTDIVLIRDIVFSNISAILGDTDIV